MIRLAQINDLPAIEAIYAEAREFMREQGNPSQWAGGYPPESLLKEDIEKQRLFVVILSQKPVACFALIEGVDPTYLNIDGGWKDDSPYVTLHRVASGGSEPHVFMKEILPFASARCPHVRIDTHEDNQPMRKVLADAGFVYCGTIHLESGDPRRAYEHFGRR